MDKISICTVSMNRLFHIRETLPANIKDNMDYTNLEFILLDYNSSDGLSNWIECQMMEYIKSGILKYCRISTPLHFDRCHSRNLACRLASGNIIALVDADNYMGKGYAAWLADMFQKEGNNTILTNITSGNLMFKDQAGKCAFHASYFQKARGFDERMNGYGFEDVDFIQRLLQAGGKRLPIENLDFFQFIGHSDVERIYNEYIFNNVVSIYTSSSENSDEYKVLRVIYLFENNNFINVTYIFRKELESDMYASYRGWVIEPDGLNSGNYRWNEGSSKLNLENFDSQEHFSVDSEGNLYTPSEKDTKWLLIPLNIEVYSQYSLLYTECWNRNIYHSNRNKDSHINPQGFGKGEVIFNLKQSILLT